MQLIGLCRLGRDADLKQTNNGKDVLNVTLAYNYGQRVDGAQPTQWIDAAIFGERASKVAQYFTKGTAIVAYLTDVHVHTFQKKDGSTGSTLRATLANFEFCGKSASGSSGEPAPAAERVAVDKPKLPGGFQDMKDDDPDGIPF